MVSNIILTCLAILCGTIVFCLILLFGMRFCKEDEEPNTNSESKSFLGELIQSIPTWVKVIAFLTTQLAIIYIISIWFPTWMANHNWVMSISSCIGIISGITFAIIIFSTNDNEIISGC